jgi:SAM-dependent methyltransferase
LHGLVTPDAARARVLELGCASGGNIIPLAARLPRAHFLGVDLVRRHIDDARARVAQLGLTNISFEQADITTLANDGALFDYVICHGVFSWVQRAVQDAILRISQTRLTPNGVAMISYNVLPGWHLRSIIRDICLAHVGADGPPKQRVAKARAILAELAASAKDSEPYGLLLRNEARRTAHRPASYILGEFLVADNTPCTFQDFVARAGQHDLDYVCEADLEAAVPETLNTPMRARIVANAGSDDALAVEQYIDYFTGRTFRCSLLAKSGAGVSRTRDYDRLRGLHLSSELRVDNSDADATTYKDVRGRTVKSQDPAVQSALARLAAAFPATLRFDELCTPADAPRLIAALTQLVAAGQVEASSLPLRVGRAGDDTLLVWALARAEAAARQPWLTSMAHAPVLLKPAVAVLIAHLDGSNGRERLKALLAQALARGELQAPELASESTEAVAALYLERVLDYLAANALLEPVRGIGIV